MALFVSFEGGEGSGKSTQAGALLGRLARAGVPAVLSREPGGTPLGQRIRYLLKRSGDAEISPLAELFLVAASRAQLVANVIGPNLEKGTVVVCDRFVDSTAAYQGYGRGISLDFIQAVNGAATNGVLPDLVILLDLPVEVGLARKKAAPPDRFESEGTAFHQRVREGYLSMAAADPQRWLVIDATLPRDSIQGVVWERVGLLLQRPGDHP
ncbi:MAG: dTMP kinase [Chloroflexi bacterium]|nr:dTMP kinase [Chloroflexota bacterium]